MLTLPLQLPPCGACTNLVTSFEAGVERTKRGKLEGGDAAWEEKSGQKYATSEVTSHNTGEQPVTVPRPAGEAGRDLGAAVQGRGARRDPVPRQPRRLGGGHRGLVAARPGYQVGHHTPELHVLVTTGCHVM